MPHPTLVSSPLLAPMVRGLLFEALFVRGLRPQGALLDELRAAGFDPEHVELRYPAGLFRQCVDIAGRSLYPAMTPEEAQRRLGHVCVRGALETLLGRTLGHALPRLGPLRYLQRFPDHVRLTTTAPVEATVTVRGERDVRLGFLTFSTTPAHFVGGTVEAGLRLIGVVPTVQVEVYSPGHFDLDVTWQQVS